MKCESYSWNKTRQKNRNKYEYNNKKEKNFIRINSKLPTNYYFKVLQK
jgi:hypothetical protein